VRNGKKPRPSELKRLGGAGGKVAPIRWPAGSKPSGAFLKYDRTGLPWVTLKGAISLDGRIATATGESRWITGGASRRRAHRLRHQVDAILVGANTARQDDPRLTVRLRGKQRKSPVRIVLDSHLRLPRTLQLFSAGKKPRTVVATLEAPKSRKARALIRLGVEVWRVGGRRGRVDLKKLVHRLGEEGLIHVLVEGGSEVNTAFLRARLADELVLFVAPKLIGSDGIPWVRGLSVTSVARALRLSQLSAERCGEDLVLRARFAPASLARGAPPTQV